MGVFKLYKWYQIVQNITYITEQTIGLFHSFPMHLSLLPENIRKPDGFLMLSGGRERVHWEQIG